MVTLALALMPAMALSVEGVQAPSQPLLADENNTILVTQAVAPSVVSVTVAIKGERLNPFLAPEQRGGGSGFVVEVGGEKRIVTNFHVVAGALKPNSVETAEGATITLAFFGAPDKEVQARVIGATLDYDLALLTLVNPREMPPEVRPLSLAHSASVRVGQKVIAIGNPFGLQSTVTTGIVSAIEREAPSAFGIDVPFIQTDAAINPGNSGGPLLDSQGKVIGINNAILTPSGAWVGVGFAVPSDLVSENLPLMAKGGLSGLIAAVTNPRQPRIGLGSQVSVEDYPESLRQSLKLPDHGAVVTEVAKGGPAARAGIKEPSYAVTVGEQLFPAGGDIIVSVDGKEVKGVQDIQRVILEKRAGEKVTLGVWRDGKTRSVTVKPQVLPPEKGE